MVCAATWQQSKRKIAYASARVHTHAVRPHGFDGRGAQRFHFVGAERARGSREAMKGSQNAWRGRRARGRGHRFVRPRTHADARPVVRNQSLTRVLAVGAVGQGGETCFPHLHSKNRRAGWAGCRSRAPCCTSVPISWPESGRKSERRMNSKPVSPVFGVEVRMKTRLETRLPSSFPPHTLPRLIPPSVKQ